MEDLRGSGAGRENITCISMAVVHGLAGVQDWRGEGVAGYLGGLITIRFQGFNRNSILCGEVGAGHLRGEVGTVLKGGEVGCGVISSLHLHVLGRVDSILLNSRGGCSAAEIMVPQPPSWIPILRFIIVLN